MALDPTDPATVDLVREAHAHGFWNALFLAFAGIVGSHVNAPVIEAKRYADSRQRQRKERRPVGSLAPGRAPADRPATKNSDDVLDTFR